MTESGDTSNPLAEQRQHCIVECVHCHGTSYVFGERARLLRRRIKLMSFFGLAVPGLVGVTVASFGIAAGSTTVFIGIAAALAIPQFALSAWSLVEGWPEQLSYADESKTANRRLADAFQRLARDQSMSQNDFKSEMQLLDQENSSRSTLDEKCDLTENEKRMGMRAALRQLQKPCAGCDIVPTSLEPSDCNICGNFKPREW